jgi:heterodisulfide reductase subunit A
MLSAAQTIKHLVYQTENHKNIIVFRNTEIKEIFGFVGNFETTLFENTRYEKKITFGNIVIATGLKTFDPSVIPNYNYKKIPDVVTSLEFENMLQTGQISTKYNGTPKNIAIIHCVGSRNPDYHEYCSRTCCMTALKYANQIHSALPETHIFDIYSDMRAFGKGCEELYTSTSQKNVMFLMFDQQNGLPEIKKATKTDESVMTIEFKEQLSGEEIEVPADLVILMVAVEAHNNANVISHAAGVSKCGNNFFIEKHPKLDPVATTTDGVYIVGTCQGPKDIPDSVAQAKAAAARILASIQLGTVEVDVITASVNEDICCGCQTCISVCPYNAISYDKERHVSVVNEILCKGCGTCGSTCPTGAIRSRHFTDKQILSQIEGLLSKKFELQET